MHVIGCLAAMPDGSWSFWYVRSALQTPDFRPLAHFPLLDREYQSSEIFPIFANRLMSPRRPDYGEFLATLDLGRDATPFDILARSTGDRATDSIRLHPEPDIDPNTGLTTCRFLAHGIRHIDGAAERVEQLASGDRLTLRPEPDNPVNARALLLDAEHGKPVGYVPDLLLGYVHRMLKYRYVDVRVDRVNPPPAPVSLRLLCHLEGFWPSGPAPFTGPDFEPIHPSDLK
jgi:hypothetical protein